MAALLAGRQPAEVGFDPVDGRVDLRGLVIREPAELRRWSTMGMGLVALERVSDSINLSISALARVDFGDGFIPHLSAGALGTISEIFDAEPPYTPRGCVAQAWSVAEVLRSWVKTAE